MSETTYTFTRLDTGTSAPGRVLLPKALPPGPGGPPAGLRMIRLLGRYSMYLIPAGLLAATAWANERGIAQAATNWGAMNMVLDDGLKAVMPNIQNSLRKNWKGLDQEAAEGAVGRFSAEAAKLRHVFADIGGVLDEIGGTIRRFWTEIMYLGGALLGTLIATLIAKRFPQLRIFATLQEAKIGKLALSGTALMVGQLSLMLASAAKTIFMEIRKMRQLKVVAPSGKVAVDFDKARFKTNDLPSFHKPDRPGELPDGGEEFFRDASPVDPGNGGSKGSDKPGQNGPTLENGGLRRVRGGSSLWEIAEQAYGDGNRWQDIYKANRDLIGPNPAVLREGLDLKIPE
ncbi:hypothetical protein ABT294_05190 [Nonomuraea sp. NPDC000554]|uniref:hypothetical protein n=1 Tax=Nonomuraea sp. NPDC000554 TaxID=3154259 RepID=UPI0033314B53